MKTQAFLWGFHVVIPQTFLKILTTTSDIVSETLAGAVGVGLGVAGVPPVTITIASWS
jgi:hypothetical protein